MLDRDNLRAVVIAALLVGAAVLVGLLLCPARAHAQLPVPGALAVADAPAA
jgi:hypothetical protein